MVATALLYSSVAAEILFVQLAIIGETGKDMKGGKDRTMLKILFITPEEIEGTLMTVGPEPSLFFRDTNKLGSGPTVISVPSISSGVINNIFSIVRSFPPFISLPVSPMIASWTNIATIGVPPASDTVCTSVSKCADWTKQTDDPNLEKKLQVSCDGTAGKWVIDQEAGGEDVVYDDEVIVNEGADPIGEPSCTGGGGQLEIPAGNIADGSQLVCDTHLAPEEGFYKMGHPNTCILLCDYQLGMTINSGLNEEGEAVFKNQDGDAVTGSAVTCWGK